jgi:hypothetical protein
LKIRIILSIRDSNREYHLRPDINVRAYSSSRLKPAVNGMMITARFSVLRLLARSFSSGFVVHIKPSKPGNLLPGSVDLYFA